MVFTLWTKLPPQRIAKRIAPLSEVIPFYLYTRTEWSETLQSSLTSLPLHCFYTHSTLF